MKTEKQKLVLEILGNGKYRIDSLRGVLQSFRVGKREWMDCVPTTLPNKYKQHIIHLGRHKSLRAVVYLHVLVWLGCNGEYDEGMVIDHDDSDPSNCALSNLRLVTHKSNIDFSIKNRPKTHKEWRVIRSEEIVKIREFVAAGKNQSAIARALDLNRLSVRYIVNKIKNGEELKFENEKPKFYGKKKFGFKGDVTALDIKSIDTSITSIPKGEYKLVGSPGKVFHHEPIVDFEKWEDMSKEEIDKEAIPHYKDKFPLI